MDDNSESSWESLFKLIGIIFGFWIILSIIGAIFPSDTVKVYPILCSIDKNSTLPFVGPGNCKNPVPVGPEQYKVSYAKQEVYQNNTSGLGVIKLANCQVFDTQNWNCDYPDKSASFNMVKGSLVMTATDPKTGTPGNNSVLGTYYTDKIDWITQKYDHNLIYIILDWSSN